jgi:hypothetical protein
MNILEETLMEGMNDGFNNESEKFIKSGKGKRERVMNPNKRSSNNKRRLSIYS